MRAKIRVGLFLAAVLVLFLLPATALAAGIQANVPALTVNDTTTTIAFAGREWYVISTGSGGVAPNSGHLTLLAKDSFGISAFRIGLNIAPIDTTGWKQYSGDTWWYQGTFTQPNDYNDSTLMRTLATAADAMPVSEAALITARDIGTDGIGGLAVNGQKLWPLSLAEYQNMGSLSGDAFSGYSWLRSPHSVISAYVAVSGGSYTSGPVSPPNIAVRPALHLNLTSVLFTSDATAGSGKSLATAGGALVGATAPTQNLKFTMRNSAQTLVVFATTAQSTQSGAILSFSYAGATMGTNQYVSCALLDEHGALKYYGKLADSSSAGSGTLSVPLSGVSDGNYVLKIFSEQTNGDRYTDFASTPIAMTVSVSSGIGTVNGFGGIISGGEDGREIELRVNATHIQWRYAGETDTVWRDLIALSALAGADGANGRDGTNGSNGADGRDGRDGQNGKNGKDGQDGARGKDGNGILSIAKTGSEGNVDTYTISFTDGTSSTFTITNGKDGVGVASAAWSKNGELVFAFTDGTQINLGPLPGAAIPANATASGDKGKSDAAVPVAAGAASGAVASGLLYWLLPLLRKKIRL